MDAQQQQHLFRFDRDLAKFSAKLGIDLTTTVKKIGFDLFGRIIKKTPVDTGRARASWTVAVNAPDRTVAPPGAHDDAKHNPGPMAQAKAGTAMANLHPFEPVWISNNLPYIEALEHGHSQQAPAGMVALSIAETEAELDAAIRVVTP